MSAFSPTGSVQRTNAIQSGLQGVERGMELMAGAAQSIASGGASDSVDFAENAVKLLEARMLVRASGKLLQVADRTLGTLLDVRS